MKKVSRVTRAFLYAFATAALIFSLSSCNGDKVDTNMQKIDGDGVIEENVEDIRLYDSENTYGIEVKPPVSLKDNSGELSDAADVII